MKWSTPPERRRSKPEKCSSWPTYPAATIRSCAARAACRRQRDGANGCCAGCAEMLAAVKAAGVPEERLQARCGDCPRVWIITRARCSRRFSTRCRRSAAFAPAGDTTIWPSLYTTQKLPGIGASLGLDRLLAGMEELGMLPKVATPAEVFIPFFDAGRLADYLRLAAALASRRAGRRSSIPNPKSSASSSSTPTAAAFAWRSSRAKTNSPPARFRSRIWRTGRARQCRWSRVRSR